MEMSEEIYVNAEITEGNRAEYRNSKNSYEDVYMNQDKSETQRPRSFEQSESSVPGMSPAGNKQCWTAVTAMCVGLLCVLLLTGITVLWINFDNLNKENDQLHANYNNLTIERDQLQKSKDELQKKVTDLDKAIKEIWILYNSSIYYISTEKKNWSESRQHCRERGADLVIINSKEEQEVMQKHSRVAWIGLNDINKEGDWKWVDNTPVDNITRFWWTGEPNSNGDEDCAMMGYGSDPVLNWADYPCTKKFVWICEKII